MDITQLSAEVWKFKRAMKMFYQQKQNLSIEEFGPHFYFLLNLTRPTANDVFIKKLKAKIALKG
eukprot:UN02285